MLDQFRAMIKSLDQKTLSDLCEKFVYEHDAALRAMLELAQEYGLRLTTDNIKELLSVMHQNGEFDHVECWGLELGANDLYRKFHPLMD